MIHTNPFSVDGALLQSEKDINTGKDNADHEADIQYAGDSLSEHYPGAFSVHIRAVSVAVLSVWAEYSEEV